MKVNLLDCTLRDGGYVNDFKFGEKRIRRIIKKLNEAKIDIIECGFLRENCINKDETLFDSIHRIEEYTRGNRRYAAMVSFDDISIEKIEPKKNKVEIIRVIFPKGKWEETKENVGKLIQKGYDVFVQPMNTTSYTDEEILKIIKEVNILKPYAFYIVDTFGSMYAKDLTRLFHLVDYNLSGDILIGFHSHNNLQLAFANALTLMSIHTKREIVLDTSCFGMGRGAGNLPTELLVQYINENIENKYNLTPLLEIIDDELLPIYSETPWGYSVPYFLAASRQCHPNYATFLINKQTIPATAIQDIIDKIPFENRSIYRQPFIEKLYLDYQSHKIDDSKTIKVLRNKLQGKNILLIAPGSSIKIETENINAYIRETSPFIIALNFIPDNIEVDLLFVSNTKRFENIDFEKFNITTVVTSNISEESDLLCVDYQSLVFDKGNEVDNAGIMLLNLLIRLGITNVALAGFDGYTKYGKQYYSPELNTHIESGILIKRTENIGKQMKVLNEKIKLNFITRSVYANYMK